jgi:hypothetical protein
MMTTPQEPGTKIRVRVTSEFQLDGIRVWMGIRYDQNYAVMLHFQEHGHQILERIDPMTESAPTMAMSDEFGRALLDALLRHYHGASDMHTLRADYLHERDRVDRMLESMMYRSASKER